MAGETKGPWAIAKGLPWTIVDGEGRVIFRVDGPLGALTHAERAARDMANAAHIVACVNACAGDYEVLQRHAEAGFEQAMHVTAERAEALAADLEAERARSATLLEHIDNLSNETGRLAAENAHQAQAITEAAVHVADGVRAIQQLREARAENERLRGALSKAAQELDDIAAWIVDSRSEPGDAAEAVSFAAMDARTALAGKGE